MTQSVGQRLLSKKVVAERVGAHPVTLNRWVRLGEFPPPIKVGMNGACRWPEHVVNDWVSTQLAKAGATGRAA